MLNSEKTADIINAQKPIDQAILGRVKKALARKGVILHQSRDTDEWLVSKGAEAVTFSDCTIVMHSNVSASGFFEELIHYGQIMSGRAMTGNIENNILMEIEVKERLIKHRQAYGITDYEVRILTDMLDYYRMELENVGKAGGQHV